METSTAKTNTSGRREATARAGGVFTVQCYDRAGNLKWEDKKHNLVVNTGLKLMNDTFLGLLLTRLLCILVCTAQRLPTPLLQRTPWLRTLAGPS